MFFSALKGHDFSRAATHPKYSRNQPARQRRARIPFNHKIWVPHAFRVFCGMGGNPRIFKARALYPGTTTPCPIHSASFAEWVGNRESPWRGPCVRAQLHRAPSIPRPLRNGWETANFHDTGFVSGHNCTVPHPFRVFCGMGGKPRIFIAQALYQGTTSVVPQMQQKQRRALAPEGCLSQVYLKISFFPQPVQPRHHPTHNILEINQRDKVAFKFPLPPRLPQIRQPANSPPPQSGAPTRRIFQKLSRRESTKIAQGETLGQRPSILAAP